MLFKMRENDLLGLAGQLACFFLLSFFPFLIFLVALAGLVLNDLAIGEQGSDRQVGASLIRRRRHSCASIACATRPASLGLVAVGR